MANPQPSSSSKFNPFDIPQKYALSPDDVRILDLANPDDRRPVGADVNAVDRGQPVNGPNRLENTANGPHAPAAAGGNAGDRPAAGSAPRGTGRQDQRASRSRCAVPQSRSRN